MRCSQHLCVQLTESSRGICLADRCLHLVQHDTLQHKETFWLPGTGEDIAKGHMHLTN